MFGLETFHIVFIVVLLAVALVVRFLMNRAMDEARKNGITDYGLEFDRSSPIDDGASDRANPCHPINN
ncbi:MAG: hypothetical protein AB7F25_02715 [Deferribacterales bacterium]